MKNKVLLSLLVIGASYLSSCKKDPDVGPKGDTGATGATGPVGPTGAQGPDGNANVKSFTFAVTPGSWSHLGTSGQPGDGYAVNITSSILTQSIFENGMAMVYMQNGNSWIALPTEFHYGSYERTFVFQHTSNSVQVEYYDSDLNTTLLTGTVTFKIVAVDGSFRKANPDLNLMDYRNIQNLLK